MDNKRIYNLKLSANELEVLDMTIDKTYSSAGFDDKDCAYRGKFRYVKSIRKRLKRLIDGN